jgi:hypothetical protein
VFSLDGFRKDGGVLDWCSRAADCGRPRIQGGVFVDTHSLPWEYRMYESYRLLPDGFLSPSVRWDGVDGTWPTPLNGEQRISNLLESIG